MLKIITLNFLYPEDDLCALSSNKMTLVYTHNNPHIGIGIDTDDYNLPYNVDNVCYTDFSDCLHSVAKSDPKDEPEKVHIPHLTHSAHSFQPMQNVPEKSTDRKPHSN